MKPICPFKVGDNVQIMGTDRYGEVVGEPEDLGKFSEDERIWSVPVYVWGKVSRYYSYALKQIENERYEDVKEDGL